MTSSFFDTGSKVTGPHVTGPHVTGPHVTGPDAPPPSGLTSFQKPHGPALLAQVRGYWEGLRVQDSIPMRSQFNPRGIEAALSSTFLLERVAPGIARFRIAGMDLAEIIGMDPRGLPISAAFCPETRPQLAAMLELVFTGPAILTMDLEAERGLGRPALSARLLLLPMRTDEGLSGLALGCLAPAGAIGRGQRRFAVKGQSLIRLPPPTQAKRPPRPMFTTFAPVPDKTTEPARTIAFAEPAARFESSGKVNSRPYLRLVTSNG
jgi:hypothetical protein